MKPPKIPTIINTIMLINGIDFHTHILPGIDDGAKDIEETKGLLQSLKKQGVSTVVLTPHYYSHKISAEDFLQKRIAAYEKVINEIESDMTFVLGSESYLTRYFFYNDEISPFCVNEKLYLLVELAYDTEFRKDTLSQFEQILDDYGKIPVLAHLERYPYLIKNKSLIQYLVDMGCLMQTNLKSIHKPFLSRKLLKLMKENLVHVVGTDCHNLTQRPPEFQPNISLIEKKLSRDVVIQLMKNAENIIMGKPVSW